MGEEVWYPLGLWYAAANLLMFILILAKNNALNQVTFTTIAQNLRHLSDELYDYFFEPCGHPIEFVDKQDQLPPILYYRPIVAASSSRFQPSVAPILETQAKPAVHEQNPSIDSTDSIQEDELNIQIPRVREIITSTKVDPTEKFVENAKKTIEEHKKYSEKKLEELRRTYQQKKYNDDYKISNEDQNQPDIKNTADAGSEYKNTSENIQDLKLDSLKTDSEQKIRDSNKISPNFADTVQNKMKLEKSKVTDIEQTNINHNSEESRNVKSYEVNSGNGSQTWNAEAKLDIQQTDKNSSEKQVNSQVAKSSKVEKKQPDNKDKTTDNERDKKNNEKISTGKDYSFQLNNNINKKREIRKLALTKENENGKESLNNYEGNEGNVERKIKGESQIEKENELSEQDNKNKIDNSSVMENKNEKTNKRPEIDEREKIFDMSETKKDTPETKEKEFEIVDKNRTNMPTSQGKIKEQNLQNLKMELNKLIPERKKENPDTITDRNERSSKKQETNKKENVDNSIINDMLETERDSSEGKQNENWSVGKNRPNLQSTLEKIKEKKQLDAENGAIEQIAHSKRDTDNAMKTFDYKDKDIMLEPKFNNSQGRRNENESVDNRIINRITQGTVKEVKNEQNSELKTDTDNAFKNEQFYKKQETGEKSYVNNKGMLKHEIENPKVKLKDDNSIDKNKDVSLVKDENNTYKELKDQGNVKDRYKINDHILIETKRKISAILEKGTKEIDHLKSSTLAQGINQYRKTSEEGKTNSKFEATKDKAAEGTLISNKRPDNESMDDNLTAKNKEIKKTRLDAASCQNMSDSLVLDEEEFEELLDKVRKKSTLFK